MPVFRKQASENSFSWYARPKKNSMKKRIWDKTLQKKERRNKEFGWFAELSWSREKHFVVVGVPDTYQPDRAHHVFSVQWVVTDVCLPSLFQHTNSTEFNCIWITQIRCHIYEYLISKFWLQSRRTSGSFLYKTLKSSGIYVHHLL
jgi:hypothetical protein